jgi:phosphoribosylaminoimidazolecarboxamide formyltransferase / IMP cyclohydrolase
MSKIKTALISVSDKTGLDKLCKSLIDNKVEIISTGGTLKAIKSMGFPVTAIDDYTGFPEMMDGRVKTLHPKVHGGLLARRDNELHMNSLKENGMQEIGLVAVNLYPFEEVSSREDSTLEQCIENIDIGGPSMIRSAAKNHASVTVLVDPSQYTAFIREFESNDGEISSELNFDFACQAFSRTAAYDAVISSYLTDSSSLASLKSMQLELAQSLRYGENPHQEAKFYKTKGQSLNWSQHHGKELSYNNLLDLDAALDIAREFSEPLCAIIKHTNPCGLSVGGSNMENLDRAIMADPVSFFGGIVIFNAEVTIDESEEMAKHFFELIIAPSFSKTAMENLTKKKNIRLITYKDLEDLPIVYRSAAGGFLSQQADIVKEKAEDFQIVTKVRPDQSLLKQMEYANKAVKALKSNAVLFWKDSMAAGMGTGQMSRVDSIRFAIEKGKMANIDLSGSILASDAFFPFRDGVDLAIQAGALAIVQPGGSKRDQESIDACDEAGIPMVFTGLRHFRH